MHSAELYIEKERDIALLHLQTQWGKLQHQRDLSGIFSIADGYYFSIKHLQEFGQFFLGVFQDTGNFHLIKGTNNGATGNALNKAEFLSGFCSNRNSLKFVIFTRWAFRPCHIVTLGK